MAILGGLSEECNSDSEIITSLEECKVAALSLGFTITSIWTEGSFDKVPGGCSTTEGGNLVFNTNYLTLECCKGRKDLSPICINKANTDSAGIDINLVAKIHFQNSYNISEIIIYNHSNYL